MTGMAHSGELTAAERKAFAAEVGRICTKLFDLSNEDDLFKLDGKWLVDIGDKSGLAHSGVYMACERCARRRALVSDVKTSRRREIVSDKLFARAKSLVYAILRSFRYDLSKLHELG